MTRDEYILLYEKMLSGNLTDQEREAFDGYRDEFELADLQWDEKSMGNRDETHQEIFNSILHEIHPGQPRIMRWKKWLVAASVTAFLSVVGLSYYYNAKNDRVEVAAQSKNSEISSQFVDRAVLTLSDGSKIFLDDNKSLVLKQDKGAVIKKTGTSIIYQKSGFDSNPSSGRFHTLVTPNHSQYHVVLEDGTKVWLNAASSLRYPVSFTEKQRVVEVSGEAYFEVAKNPKKPFKVFITNIKDKKTEVEVLGTHFNIQAYSKEDQKVTLLEGSVKVKNTNRRDVVLDEGEQLVLRSNSDQSVLAKVDTTITMAWRNGLFVFNKEPIYQVMAKIARWYDVEVVFNGNMTNKVFVATMSKEESLSDVLKTLELTGTVKFEVKGKKVFVK